MVSCVSGNPTTLIVHQFRPLDSYTAKIPCRYLIEVETNPEEDGSSSAPKNLLTMIFVSRKEFPTSPRWMLLHHKMQ